MGTKVISTSTSEAERDRRGVNQAGCLICGNVTLRMVFFGKDMLHNVSGEYSMMRCPACGLYSIAPQPSLDALKRHYPENYDAYGTGYSRLVDRIVEALGRQRARRLRSLAGKNARLLEIGCGDGRLLHIVQQETGWDVIGTDMNETAVRRAAERGVKAALVDAENLDFPERSFDIVLMRHVVEHLRAPRLVLGKVYDLLKTDGILVIAFPNAGCLEMPVFGRHWMGFDVPRHLFTFDVELMARLLVSEGFSVRNIRHEGVPNNWIGSLAYMFGGVEHGNALGRMFRLGNPLLLAIFTPISMVQAAMRISGSVELTARRTQT